MDRQMLLGMIFHSKRELKLSKEKSSIFRFSAPKLPGHIFIFMGAKLVLISAISTLNCYC